MIQHKQEKKILRFVNVNVDYQNKILYFDLTDYSFTRLEFESSVLYSGVVCWWTVCAICVRVWWHGKTEDLEISAGLVSCIPAAAEEQIHGAQMPSFKWGGCWRLVTEVAL